MARRLQTTGVNQGCDSKVSDCHPETIPRSRFVNGTARECTHRLDDGRRSSEIEQQLRNMEAARESTHGPRSSASQTHAQCINDLDASSD